MRTSQRLNSIGSPEGLPYKELALADSVEDGAGTTSQQHLGLDVEPLRQQTLELIEIEIVVDTCTLIREQLAHHWVVGMWHFDDEFWGEISEHI